MLDLAPNHKSGLVVANPVLLGGGVLGCAENIPHALKQADCGAAVMGPFTWSSRRGQPAGRLAEGYGAFVLDSGIQNRGARSSVKRFSRTWKRLGFPVIAQIADSQVDDALRTGREMERSDTVSGLELLPRQDCEPAQLDALVRALALETELPLWVKVPYARALEFAAVAADAGVDALVVSQAPMGMLPAPGKAGWLEADSEADKDAFGTARTVSGPLFGPAVFPLILQLVRDVAALNLGVPVLACGGIHSWPQAAAALTAGASAIQLDGALWVEPGMAVEIVNGWKQAGTLDLLE
jgi:dihydroorotate dehydrogenase